MAGGRARGVELVVLDHRVMSLLLALEDDVEEGVQAVVACQRPTELTLFDAELVRLVPVPVQHPGNEAFRAQPPGLGAPARLPRLHLQLDSLASHFRRRSVPMPP